MSNAVIELVDQRIEVNFGPQQGQPGQDGTDGEKGDPGSAGEGYATRTALAASTATVGDDAFVIETGAAGKFVAVAYADVAALVDLDSTAGIYKRSTSDPSIAWVRQFDGPIMVDWFLVTPGAFTTSAIIQKIEDLREAGQPVKFGAKTYAFSGVKIQKGGHWSGVGKLSAMQDNGAGASDTFFIAGENGTRISHMRFTGLYDADNSGANFPIMARAFRPGVEGIGPAEIADLEFDHLWFDGCDTGIRVMYYGIGPTNDVPGTTWYTPIRTHIHDCVFKDVLYQCILPEAHDVTIERCHFKLSAKPVGGYRPFSHTLRVLGCNRVNIRQNHFEVPLDYSPIGVMNAGTDNGLSNIAFRAARNVTIEDNRFYGGNIKIVHSADLLRVANNFHWSDPSSTTEDLTLYAIGTETFPHFFGRVEIEGNYAAGYTRPIILENSALHQVSVKRNTLIGNKKVGGVFDILPVRIQINEGTKLQDGVTNMRPPVLLEFEDNSLFCNPSTTGAYIGLSGDMTGMHFSYTGNKLSERAYNINHLTHGFPAGTTPKVSVSRDGAWTDFSALTGLQADIVGDNRAMPSGFFASLMASSLFRPEQTVDAFPPDFA